MEDMLLLPFLEISSLATRKIQHATALLAVVVDESELDPVVQTPEMKDAGLLAFLLRLVLLVVELSCQILVISGGRCQRRELTLLIHCS